MRSFIYDKAVKLPTFYFGDISKHKETEMLKKEQFVIVRKK